MIQFTFCITWLPFVAAGRTQPCDIGFWGERCENKCDRTCTCENGCNKQTGKCISCENGYWGSYCTERCPDKCGKRCSLSNYRQGNLCVYGRKCGPYCYQESGKCNPYYSCTDGFWGGYFNNTCVAMERCLRCRYDNGSYCYECKTGFWGAACERKCLGNCFICNKYSGRCNSFYCSNGFYGSNCENLCTIPHCEKCLNNSYCQECENGYWGPNCSSCSDTQCFFCNHKSGVCERCKDGYWGDSCEYMCKNGCAEVHCDKHTGRCPTCKANYCGDTCNNSCKLDRCSSAGQCSKEKGPVCNHCDPGRWGNLCENKCSTNCSGGCKKSTGDCYIVEHDTGSVSKVQGISSTEIISNRNETEYKANVQISETTIVGISIGTSLAVVMVFMVAVVLVFRFCYIRMEAKVEKKIASQKDCISYNTDQQKTMLKGFDNPLVTERTGCGTTKE